MAGFRLHPRVLAGLSCAALVIVVAVILHLTRDFEAEAKADRIAADHVISLEWEIRKSFETLDRPVASIAPYERLAEFRRIFPDHLPEFPKEDRRVLEAFPDSLEAEVRRLSEARDQKISAIRVRSFEDLSAYQKAYFIRRLNEYITGGEKTLERWTAAGKASDARLRHALEECGRNLTPETRREANSALYRAVDDTHFAIWTALELQWETLLRDRLLGKEIAVSPTSEILKKWKP